MSERSYTEGELTQWLETTGITPRPDYVDDLLTQTARSRQRSAWRFPERWLPMDLTARAPTITGRQVPFRLIGLVALLVLALAVGAALFVGSQRRLPAPFGPAANGLIVYAAPTDPSWMGKSDYQRPIGDIMTVDPITGASSTLVGGPTVDGYPVVSLDGTRVAFVREADFYQMLYVVETSGGDPRALTDGSAHRNRQRCLVAGRRVDRLHRDRRRTVPASGSREPTAAMPTGSIWARTCRSSCRSGDRRMATNCSSSGRRPTRPASFLSSATAICTAARRTRPGRRSGSISSIRTPEICS